MATKSLHYTAEQIDERLLQNYLDDYNNQNNTSLSKEEFLIKLYNILTNPLIKKETKANWISLNPLLKNGEFGLESDTGKFKIGDGINNWNNLIYYGISFEEINYLVNNKLNTIQESSEFYITDSKNNVIAKISNKGIHSVDFLYGKNEISLINLLNTLSNEIRIEKSRAESVESNLINNKLNRTLDDDKLVITDPNGFVIFKVDKDGAHFPNSSSLANLNIDDDKLVITDPNGFIALKIDRNGISSIKNKYNIACMVISENYYPISIPVRNNEGNITHVDVRFETGVIGELNISYINGLSSSIEVIYNNNNYIITISRDNEGNAKLVSVEEN